LFLDNISGSKNFIYKCEKNISITASDLSPKMDEIAVGKSNGTFMILDTLGNELQKVVENDKKVKLSSISYSPDGTIIASGNIAGIVKVWDINGNLLQAIKVTNRYRYNGITDITMSYGNQMIATAVTENTDNYIRVFNRKGILEYEFIGHLQSIDFMKFSSDNSLLISKDQEGVVKVWSIEEKQFLMTLRGKYKRVDFFPLSERSLEVEDMNGKIFMIPILPILPFSLKMLHDRGVKLEPNDLRQVLIKKDTIN